MTKMYEFYYLFGKLKTDYCMYVAPKYMKLNARAKNL